MNKQIGLSVSIFELIFLVAIIIAAVFVCKVVNPAEKSAFGASPEAAYNTSYVGARLGLVGELRGRGGNQHTRFLDVATANNTAAKGVRAYYSQALLRKGAPVVVEGVVTQAGRVKLTRITFIVNDPPK